MKSQRKAPRSQAMRDVSPDWARQCEGIWAQWLSLPLRWVLGGMFLSFAIWKANT